MGPAGHRGKSAWRRRIYRITSVLGAHDDHVLLFAPVSTFSAHAYLHDKLHYDPKDLTPIARVANTLIGLGVPAGLGESNLKELREDSTGSGQAQLCISDRRQ
jgi:hypothetical protein